MSGLPLLSTRTGPNQDLYARALASIYRAGFRVHDPDYALSRDPDPFDKLMKDPIVRSRIETRANRIATSTWEVQPGGPEDGDKLLAELMTKALEHIQQFTSKRRIQTYADIRGRGFQFIEGVRENTSLAGHRARWWLPRNLVDVDRRRFRWMVHHEGGDTTQLDVRPEMYSVRRDRWEKIDGQLHLFVKSIMDDQEMRLNYGRGLAESGYFYLWMKGEVLLNGLQGVETWAQGKTYAKIDGLRDAATGLPNETAQAAWLEVLEIFKSQHVGAIDAADEIVTQWPTGTGNSMVMDFLHYLDDGVTALLLGAVLPFGGGGDVGSLARAETEKSVHEEIMQGRRDAYDEDYTRDLLGLTMRMNRQNIRALGLQDAERPVFKSIVPKVKNTKENVQLIAVARQSVPLPKDWVYEQIDAPQPTQEDFDNDNVFLPDPAGMGGGGLPGGVDIGRGLGLGRTGQPDAQRDTGADSEPTAPGEAPVPGAATPDTNAEGDPVGADGVPIAAEGVEPPNMQEVSLALERAIKNADRKTASITRRQLWSIMGVGDAPDIDDAEWQEMQGAGSNGGGGMPGEPPVPGEPESEGDEGDEIEPPDDLSAAPRHLLGRWVTIGADDGEDGGSRVFIDDSGTITKGPAGVEGKKIDAIDKGKEGTPAEEKREKESAPKQPKADAKPKAKEKPKAKPKKLKRAKAKHKFRKRGESGSAVIARTILELQKGGVPTADATRVVGAVEDYTGTGFKEVGQFWRDGDEKHRQMAEDVEAFIDGRVAAQGSFDASAPLFRGVVGDFAQQMIDQATEGGELSFQGTASAASNQSVLDEFFGDPARATPGIPRVLLEIQGGVARSASVTDLSLVEPDSASPEAEAEVLLGNGSRFRIGTVKADQDIDGKFTRLVLEEIR